MKVAILSESPADQEAIVILAAAILGRKIEPVSLKFRPSGWSSVITALPIQIKYLYYRTDVEAMLVMLDSDDTPVHRPDHQTTAVPACRFCQVKGIWGQTIAALAPLSGRAPLRIAIAIPVPALEAWLQCGKDPHAEEAAFIRRIDAGKHLGNERRALKRRVYGAEKPDLQVETEIGIREATRLAGELDRLRTRFPIGFGSLYETLVSWR